MDIATIKRVTPHPLQSVSCIGSEAYGDVAIEAHNVSALARTKSKGSQMVLGQIRRILSDLWHPLEKTKFAALRPRPPPSSHLPPPHLPRSFLLEP